MATDVTLTIAFALVSLAVVDTTADDASQLSDVHEGSLGCGGFNGERTTSPSFAGEMRRGGVAWAS